MASIAKKYGFSDWRTIYDHADNAEFRRNRPDPHVIYPGDELFIPDKEHRDESGETEQRHLFRAHRPAMALRLILQDEENNPWANRAYKLSVDGREFEGTTDAQGLIDLEIPADAESGLLTVWLPPRRDDDDKEILRMDYVDQEDQGEEGGTSAGQTAQEPQGPSNGEAESAEEEAYSWELAIGHLDPVETVSGVQARLYNLGFSPGPIDNIAGPLTREAVRRFQAASDLEEDGVPGPNTQAKLKELHGC